MLYECVHLPSPAEVTITSTNILYSVLDYIYESCSGCLLYILFSKKRIHKLHSYILTNIQTYKYLLRTCNELIIIIIISIIGVRDELNYIQSPHLLFYTPIIISAHNIQASNILVSRRKRERNTVMV